MDDSKLWCVHVIGPDDVYAMPDYEAALFRADDINRHLYRRVGGEKRHENDAVIIAHPDAWPRSPEDHAVDMARGDERFK